MNNFPSIFCETAYIEAIFGKIGQLWQTLESFSKNKSILGEILLNCVTFGDNNKLILAKPSKFGQN